MRYTVRISVEVPVGRGELEPLRAREGARLILEQIHSIAMIEGPGGVRVLVCAVQVQGRRRGVSVDAVVEAPSPETAETGMRLAVARLLLELPEVRQWQVTGCSAGPVSGSAAC